MAACGFGASGLKIKNLDFGSLRPKLRTLQPLHGLRTSKIVRFDGLVLSRRSRNSIIGCRISASEVDSNADVEDKSEETKSTDEVSTLIPNAFEVESLLTVLCDTTSIAEFELKLGGFRLYVSRDLAKQVAPPEPPVPAPVTAHTVVETPASNGSASSPSLALSRPISSSGGVQTLLDKAADEGLVILQSPRVGYFRRSRTIKGKRAPPSCKEKDTVKEGQVLCYIEQLGGEIPIEMLVEKVMELVELTPLRGGLVGLPGVNGLSAEQRKRLTIAVELVANPSIIFMDEPTSAFRPRCKNCCNCDGNSYEHCGHRQDRGVHHPST